MEKLEKLASGQENNFKKILARILFDRNGLARDFYFFLINGSNRPKPENIDKAIIDFDLKFETASPTDLT